MTNIICNQSGCIFNSATYCKANVVCFGKKDGCDSYMETPEALKKIENEPNVQADAKRWCETHDGPWGGEGSKHCSVCFDSRTA